MRKLILGLSFYLVTLLLPFTTHAATPLERIAIPDTDISIEMPVGFAIKQDDVRGSSPGATGSQYVVLENKARTVSVTVANDKLGLKKAQMDAYKDLLLNNLRANSPQAKAVQLDEGRPAWFISFRTRHDDYHFNNVILITSVNNAVRVITFNGTDKLSQQYNVSATDLLLSIKFNE